MKIARRFNAGFGRRSPQVPKGRLISQWRALGAENTTEIGTDAGPPKHSVVPSGLVRFAIFPGVKTPGYSQTSLRDVSRQQRTRLGRLKVGNNFGVLGVRARHGLGTRKKKSKLPVSYLEVVSGDPSIAGLWILTG